MTRNQALGLGLAATVVAAVLWHGPGGAGARFADRLDREARTMLDSYEMTAVDVRAERHPLTRRLIFKGPGDAFQRAEMVRMAETLPGVGEARWSPPHSRLSHPLPMLAETVAMALVVFFAGLVLGYVLTLRAAKGDWR